MSITKKLDFELETIKDDFRTKDFDLYLMSKKIEENNEF